MTDQLQRRASPPSSLARRIAIVVATVVALGLGLVVGVLATFALSYAESGGPTITLPIQVATTIGGALMGIIALAPLALYRRQWRPIVAGAALFAVVGLALSPWA